MIALFPDFNPPGLPSEVDVDEACIWLLAVMDEADKRRKFVASVLTFYFERGHVTERQMDALQGIVMKTMGAWGRGDLECQGAQPVEAQKVTFGKVIDATAMMRGRADGEVLE
jgi:hypothetical protein